MKRLISVLALLAIGAWSATAMAANYHTGTTLICSDCHVAHGSQSHSNNDPRGAPFDNVHIGAAKPYEYLLRNEPNELCLTCHDNNATGPDVMGDNHGKYATELRQAGALNMVGIADPGYDIGDGHTLGSTEPIPGNATGIVLNHGLECVDCHSQHGSASQYRNLLNRSVTKPNGSVIPYAGRNVTFELGTSPTNTKDVLLSGDLQYAASDVKFEEPRPDSSAYGQWCKACHTDFHGKGGETNMGGASGGYVLTGVAWKRHPTADVNVGGAVTDSMTHVSSLAQYRAYYVKGDGHYPKVMDSQGLWTGAYNATTRTGNNTLTPSCFSCHKGHGNKSAFGLIFMGGTAAPSEEGDGGDYRLMCRGCHRQGA
jgi:cytochrome c553